MSTNNKSLIKQSIICIMSIAGLVAFFLLVDPEGKPLVYIFMPVILVWVALFFFAQITMTIIFKNKSLMRSIIVFVAVSTAVLLLLLSGVDQLSGADIILSLGLVTVSSFYFYRMWS